VTKSWATTIPFLLLLLTSCNSTKTLTGQTSLNSRYNDEQPALSGDGRWLALVTNRNGNSQIAVYDFQKKRFTELSGLNQQGGVAQHPSLSRTGRYLVYLLSIEGRPQIVLYDRAIQRSELLTQNYRSLIRNPAISPEGRYITFETDRRGQWDIEVLDRGANIELDIVDGTSVTNP
jgi:Tol biopolymer transport system component